MIALHIDFETRSVVDLQKSGVHTYARDPSTDVWCMAYAFDDEDPQIMTWQQVTLPSRVYDHVKNGGIVVAHNVAFELDVWNEVMAPRYGWPALKPEQCRCTMAMAYAMALPGDLDGAAAALGIDHRKDAAGYRLMLQMCKPRTLDPLTWWDEQEKRQRLYEYCKQDVRVEREIEKRMLPLSASEQELWFIDYRINNGGVMIDVPSVDRALGVIAVEAPRLDALMSEATGGAVEKCSQIQKLKRYVETAQGTSIDSLAKADIQTLLDSDGVVDDTTGKVEVILSPDVRKALEVRKEAGKTSNAKLDKMIQLVGEGSRIYNTAQYHGAGTGRWGARGIQHQNMPRPDKSWKYKHSVDVIRILNEAETPEESAAILDVVYGNVTRAISFSLRSFIVATPGHDLIEIDFSGIEARVLPWLAGEQWLLDAFADDQPIYEIAASKIYGVSVEDVNGDQRQIGKVATLACGYQGAVGAFQKMAKTYGVVVPDEIALRAVHGWRNLHPKVVSYWYDVERAAIAAVKTNDVYSVGPKGRQVSFRVRGSFLWCKLPSGRVLCYPYPQLLPGKFGNDQVHYMSVNGTTKQWELTNTYGGKFVENIDQAVSRDLLAHAIKLFEDIRPHGWKTIFHIHDSICGEVLKSAPERALEDCIELMCCKPDWAEGLPIAAEGWRDERFHK